ncbi:flavodoxin domain-containing protein [Loktanella agnita]|uniref:flavodoxin domain-containing protein n=1 Tax=Loktanella agnita TaxID=287097 RepID=UPI0039862E76
MKILIAYATTEGQTRKIVRFCADHLIALGHSVELLGAADADDLALVGFDAALLAASVHMGHYQSPVLTLAKREAAALAGMTSAFLSVSLAAAGDDPEDVQGLQDCVACFASETGWTPAEVFHVAGAFRFSEYDFFKSWAMRWIAMQKGQTVNPHQDTEYTDWAALKGMIDRWIGG